MKKTLFSTFLAGFWLVFGVGQVLAAAGDLPQYTASPSASLRPTPSITPRVTVAASPTGYGKNECQNLSIVSGNNQIAPAEVVFQTQAEAGLREFRYHFGDGQIQESDSSVTHRYAKGGEYIVFVEVKDRSGKWVTSPDCKESVMLKTAPLVQQAAVCSELVVKGDGVKAPARVTLEVLGTDNKEKVTSYKVEFGDGKNEESHQKIFEHTYDSPGTYEAKGFIKDSTGKWIGGEGACSKKVKILTEVIEKQPETGAPIQLLLASVFSGLSGSLLYLRRRLTD